MSKLVQFLEEQGACEDGLAWVSSLAMGPRDLWYACGHGDWLLWMTSVLGVPARTVAPAVFACVELALPHLRPQERESHEALFSHMRAWAAGEAYDRRFFEAAFQACRGTKTAIWAPDYASQAVRDAAFLACGACDSYHQTVTHLADMSGNQARGPVSAHVEAYDNMLRRCAHIVRTHLSFEQHIAPHLPETWGRS